MRISQADYRTVRVESEGLTLLLRYSLYQDDEERLPESISCEGSSVAAYFLASTIRDRIGETPQGFYVERRWKILREGRFALPFILDLPSPAPFLFPGALAGTRPPAAPLRRAEGRVACPNGLYVFTQPEALAVFSDPEPNPEERGSVALWSLRPGEQAAARLEVRYPDATRPAGRAPGRRARRASARAPLLPCLMSAGSLERAHRLNVVCAPRAELGERTVEALLQRLPAAAWEPADAGQLRERLEQETRQCVEQELVQEGGVCGLRRAPGHAELSTLASCGLALLLLRACPRDAQRVETALRLADFALKAQHPGGLFYERFDTTREAWPESLPAAAEAGGSGPALPARSSAAVASRLAQIAGLLRGGKLNASGLQGARYLHAARRLGDALIAADPRLEGIGERLAVDGLRGVQMGAGGLAFLELYGELHALTGRDAYRKAWSALRGSLLAPEARAGAPRVGTEPARARHLEEALLRAHLALLAARPARPAARGSARASPAPALSGAVLELVRSAFSELLPWIYLNGPDSRLCGRIPTGALMSSLEGDMLVLRGLQTSHLLLSLDRLLGKRRTLAALRQLVAWLIGCTLQGPLGAGLPLSGEAARLVPPEAATRIEELLGLQRLLVEFPTLFRKSPARGRDGVESLST